MPGDVIESMPIAPPVSGATSSADLAAEDAAWNDTATDTGAGVVDKPADEVTPEEEGVIVDKPVIAAVIPPPKPGKAAPDAADKGEGDAVESDKAGNDAVVTPEAKSEKYWKKLTDVFPGAYAVSQSEKFKSWFASLSPADKAAANNLDDPDASIKIMGRYSDDVNSGRVAEPQPPAPPKAFDISEHIKSRNMDGLKIKLSSGEETTLGSMAKPEEFGDIISAVGAMTSASEQNVMNQATQLIQNLVDQGILVTGDKFNQLLERLGEKDLAGKVPDAPAIVSDPKFMEFRDKQPLLKKAWASGDAESRAEVIAMFKADKARNTVTETSSAQRRTSAAKNDLHKGTIRSGAQPRGEEGKSEAEQEAAAWDTPIIVEGQKV